MGRNHCMNSPGFIHPPRTLGLVATALFLLVLFQFLYARWLITECDQITGNDSNPNLVQVIDVHGQIDAIQAACMGNAPNTCVESILKLVQQRDSRTTFMPLVTDLLGRVFGFSLDRVRLYNQLYVWLTILALFSIGLQLRDPICGVLAAFLSTTSLTFLHLATHYEHDFQALAFTTLVIACLLWTQGFRRPWRSLLFGTVFGIGLLFRPHILFYCGGLILWETWQILRLPTTPSIPRIRRFFNLIPTMFPVLVLTTIGYAKHTEHLLGLFTARISAYWTGINEQNARLFCTSNNPPPCSFEAALFYPLALVQYLSPLVGLLALFALGFLLWKRSRGCVPILLWLASSLVFLTVIPTKQERYILPALPALSLACALAICSLRTSLGRSLAFAALLPPLVSAPILYNPRVPIESILRFMLPLPMVSPIGPETTPFCTKRALNEIISKLAQSSAVQRHPLHLNLYSSTQVFDPDHLHYLLWSSLPGLVVSKMYPIEITKPNADYTLLWYHPDDTIFCPRFFRAGPTPMDEAGEEEPRLVPLEFGLIVPGSPRPKPPTPLELTYHCMNLAEKLEERAILEQLPIAQWAERTLQHNILEQHWSCDARYHAVLLRHPALPSHVTEFSLQPALNTIATFNAQADPVSGLMQSVGAGPFSLTYAYDFSQTGTYQLWYQGPPCRCDLSIFTEGPNGAAQLGTWAFPRPCSLDTKGRIWNPTPCFTIASPGVHRLVLTVSHPLQSLAWIYLRRVASTALSEQACNSVNYINLLHEYSMVE
ncbi:MAG: hypothetical protein A2284_04095 [Deltaproteobacteria bacterium RIFOXYA12_FULL_61_11]|nr:MAG: hypothetical protein A2284_04095 [Deltaproteobacteria bacterium RIFOXYA12_FULL_61_11]